ncbi:hypothetical protein L6452_32562 [Arctium lappa]|uniref:Uncharacterized protein n=1 Tax=Arctium lappa TaxID=4217 RepID=A0ACB8Z991_ARCLA|nr:hypothetical protein L6452_32562 [Arctium lappa]
MSVLKFFDLSFLRQVYLVLSFATSTLVCTIMASENSVDPISAIGENPDLALIHPSDYLLLYPNNHHVDLENLKINPLVLDILRGHPIYYALAATANVPLIYLQQAWKSIEFVSVNNNRYFEIQIDHFTSILNYQRLRLILDLPEANSRTGRTNFDPYPIDSEIF